MSEHVFKFGIDDRARVTGDIADWEHELLEGTEVTILVTNPSLGHTYGSSYKPGYGVSYMYEMSDGGWQVGYCDIAEVDLEELFEPVTEEELAEVYRLLTN